MNKARPAYSLIFSFVIMTLIMAIASTSIQDTRQKLQLFRELESSSQARLAGVSAAELGIVALKDSNFTAETETDGFCLEEDGTSDCQSEGSYTIYPYMSENTDAADGYYYLPTPGTGNAAPTDDCSILDDDKDVDHACNWNKLAVGDSVTIPMYYDDGSGNLYFPSDTAMGFSAWYLRLRTPCENGSIAEDCDGGDRYEINDESNYLSTTNNPAVVLWEFVGETSSGSTSIIPNDSATSGARNFFENTEIYEGLIEDDPFSAVLPINNVVLMAYNGSSAFTGLVSIYDFVNISGYADLYFNMNTINTLEDTSGATIPYLEYQVVLDSSGYPMMALSSEVVGKGYYESGDYTYYFPYTISTNNTDTTTTLYTLSN